MRIAEDGAVQRPDCRLETAARRRCSNSHLWQLQINQPAPSLTLKWCSECSAAHANRGPCQQKGTAEHAAAAARVKHAAQREQRSMRRMRSHGTARAVWHAPLLGVEAAPTAVKPATPIRIVDRNSARMSMSAAASSSARAPRAARSGSATTARRRQRRGAWICSGTGTHRTQASRGGPGGRPAPSAPPPGSCGRGGAGQRTADRSSETLSLPFGAA